MSYLLTQFIRSSTRSTTYARCIGLRWMSSAGDYGSGAGKGGGSGGSIRDAGGSFGKMEAAHEEQYFRKLKAEQLARLREQQEMQSKFHEDQVKLHEKMQHVDEYLEDNKHNIELHEEQIKLHMEKIQKHKEALKKLREDSD